MGWENRGALEVVHRRPRSSLFLTHSAPADAPRAAGTFSPLGARGALGTRFAQVRRELQAEARAKARRAGCARETQSQPPPPLSPRSLAGPARTGPGRGRGARVWRTRARSPGEPRPASSAEGECARPGRGGKGGDGLGEVVLWSATPRSGPAAPRAKETLPASVGLPRRPPKGGGWEQ